MKTTLLSIFAFAVAIGSMLGQDQDQDQDQVKPPKSRESVARVAPPRHVDAAPRMIPQAPQVQRNVNATPRFQPRVNSNLPNRVYSPRFQGPVRTFSPPDQDAPRPTATGQTDVNLQNRDWRTRVRNPDSTVIAPRPPQNLPTTVQSNTTVQNRDWRTRTDQNRNWQNNNPSGTWSYEDARRRRHHHHHRDWWRSHFTRFALFGGGYYYWDNNYWYPAYGYDPYYSTYSYNEPIYSYQDLDPGQVIASVQTELQRLGYYRYAVDGLMGPATREALARFQRDNGLAITAAIDRPTLRSLRLG